MNLLSFFSAAVCVSVSVCVCVCKSRNSVSSEDQSVNSPQHCSVKLDRDLTRWVGVCVCVCVCVCEHVCGSVNRCVGV